MQIRVSALNWYWANRDIFYLSGLYHLDQLAAQTEVQSRCVGWDSATTAFAEDPDDAKNETLD